MSFEVVVIPDAKREIKVLSKKYRSFKDDLKALVAELETTPQQGESLGKDCFKVRLAISSKNKGKSGGARVITCVKVIDETVFLIAAYDKSGFDSLQNNVIEQRLRNVGL